MLPQMAGNVSIAKSSVSRRFVEAGTRALEESMSRRFGDLDILALYLDGIVVSGHHILAAVGVDGQGRKHLLRLVQGASENARVVKDLLTGLIEFRRIQGTRTSGYWRSPPAAMRYALTSKMKTA